MSVQVEAEVPVLVPQEKPLLLSRRTYRLSIGIPKLQILDERRIPLTPDGVRQLVQHGHRVRIQAGAGKGAGFADREYAENGAEIVDSLREVLQAEIILQMFPHTEEEIQLMDEKHILISPLQLQTLQRSLLEKMAQRKITGIAMEYFQDKPNSYPIRRSMSQIAGTAAIFIAGEYLISTHGAGILLANITGIEPPQVVVIGAGTVGEHAARTALALGLQVTLFDYSVDRLLRVQKVLPVPVSTSILYPEALRQALRHCDVAVGALSPQHGRTPLVVTEDMVSEMKPGAVIVDVSIDHGGCFETSEVTTHSHPVFTRYGVIHYCVPNIPSRYPRTASSALSNILTPFFLELGRIGGLEKALRLIDHYRQSVYMYRGLITHLDVAERFRLKYADIRMIFMIPEG